MVNTLEDLQNKLIKEWSKLDEVSWYLNDEGEARKDALRAMIWHIPFFETINEFRLSEELQDLLSIEGKNPEYYKTIERIKRILDTTSVDAERL